MTQETYRADDTAGYFAIEDELQKRKEQRESVKGKETPFRVEFRYPHGTRHYQYFCTLEDAENAEDSQCGYSPFGHAVITHPTSRQVQVQGPRGGWKKYNPEDKS